MSGQNETPLFRGVVEMQGDGPPLELEDLTAFAHKAEEGGYWAEVPALPGCFTQGETLDELAANLDEAIAGWLEVQTAESLTAQGISFRPASLSSRPSALPLFRRLEFAA